MKHSNPTLRKPSLGRVNFDLGITKLDKSDPNWYVIDCPDCGKEWAFKLKDLPDKVVKCPQCGWEEVFFKHNFIWETYEEQSDAAKAKLAETFGTTKVAQVEGEVECQG